MKKTGSPCVKAAMIGRREVGYDYVSGRFV